MCVYIYIHNGTIDLTDHSNHSDNYYGNTTISLKVVHTVFFCAIGIRLRLFKPLKNSLQIPWSQPQLLRPPGELRPTV